MPTKQELIDALNAAAETGDYKAANELAEFIEAGRFDAAAEYQPAAAGSLTPEQYAERYGDAPDIGGLIAEPAPETERPLLDRAIGAGEAALAAGAGATTGFAGMLAGTVKGIIDEVSSGNFGSQEAANRIANTAADFMNTFTYSPRTQSGQEYIGAIGEAGEALASLAGLAPQVSAISQSARAAAAPRVQRAIPQPVQRSQETGIPITRGEAERYTPEGFGRLKEEQFLLEQSGETGDALRAFKLNQSNEVKKYIESLAPEQKAEVGPAIKQALELRQNSALFKRKQAYDRLAEVTKDIDVNLSPKSIESALPDAGEFRDFAAINQPQYNALTNLMTEFGLDNSPQALAGAAKAGVKIEPVSIKNYERLRKRLNAIEKTDQTGNTSRIVGPIRDALDSEFEAASKALEASGNPSVAAAAKNARLSHIALKTEFDEKGLVDQLVSDKSFQSRLPSIEESQVYSKLVAKSTPIEQFDRVVGSLDRAAGRGKLAKNTLKAEMITDLLDSSYNAASRTIQGERTFSGVAFSKRFDQLEPKLKRLFSEDEFSQLQRMRKQAEDLVPPSGAVPKGSAGFFIDAANQLGIFALMNKIPTVGPIMGNQIQEMGRNAQRARIAGEAVSGYKPPAELSELVRYSYPALATGLGVQVISEEE